MLKRSQRLSDAGVPDLHMWRPLYYIEMYLTAVYWAVGSRRYVVEMIGRVVDGFCNCIDL